MHKPDNSGRACATPERLRPHRRVKTRGLILFSLMGGWLALHGQVANNDLYVTPADTTLTVAAPGVVANDSSISTNTVTLVAGPANGVLTLNQNGGFTYTPTNNFTGVDNFTYQAKRGPQLSGIAVVDLMVTAPGEIFYDNYVRPNSGGGVFPWVPVSRANVIGTWTLANQFLTGTATYSNYSLAYYANNSWSNYSVQAQIRFSADNAASAALVGRLNASTGAHYDAWIYPERSTEFLATTNGTAVLRLIKYQNWTYPYTLIGNPIPLSGTGTDWHALKLTFQANKITVAYDGNALATVTDDGSIDGNPAYLNGGIGLDMWSLPPANYAFTADHVIVTTNNNALANYDAYNCPSNGTLRVVAPGILANDIGMAPLTALLSTGPAHGNLTLTNNGGFSYTPTNNYSGPDSFLYQSTDGYTTSGVTRVSLTVNKAALAYDDAYTVGINTPFRLGAPGILANDTGGNGPLTAALVTGPVNGTLTLTNNGGFSYTPANGYTGNDSFTYLATDGQTTSTVVVVSLKVIPGLTATGDFYSTASGTTLTLPAAGILLNDVTTNGSLTAALAGHPGHGNFSWDSDGSFTYTPTNNFTGMDGFTYRASNGSQTSSITPVDVMVLPPGSLFYDNFLRPTGVSSIFPWVPLLGSWRTTNNTLIGTCDFTNNGYAYYHNPAWTDYSVQAQIRFSSSNAWGGGIGGRLNPGTGAHYSVWVYPENSPWGPQNGSPAGTATLQIAKYQSWQSHTVQNLIPLPAVGTNFHTVKLAFQGANIFAYFDGNQLTNLVDNGLFDGQRAYTNGGILLEMWATAPTAYTLTASNVTVNPLVLKTAYNTSQNTALNVPAPGVLTNALDVYGTNLTTTLVSGPISGTVNLNTNGSFSYTPTANFVGTDGFTIQAKDGLNSLGTAPVTVNVIASPTLTVTADNQTRTYGTTNPTLTASVTGFINGDGTNVLTGTPALNVNANPGSAAGSYTIAVSQGTLSATNYGFIFTNGTLTIHPAILTVTAGNTNKVYGQLAAFAGTEFTTSGLTNSDTVTSVTLTSSGAAAIAGVSGSPYPINATNATGSGLNNYTINYQPGILTVSAPSLTVQADNQTRMYGLTNPVLTASFNGFVNSENATVLSGSPLLNTPATPASLMGGYPITVAPGTLSNANYSFVFTNGTLTVTSAPVPVIYSIGLTNQIITLAWSSVAGANYGLQSTTNLMGTNWSTASASVTALGSTTSQTNDISNKRLQFYRVLLLPAGL
jgi:large repetitive protein